jgi:hypothetical protein
MGKPRFGHCHKRQGQPRAPISKPQLAREGRLKPEAVTELIEAGKLDQHAVAQLRAVRIYPEKYLRPYWDARQFARTTTKGKTVSKAVRSLTFRVIRWRSTLRPWQVVTGKDPGGLSVYASYKYLDHAIAAATKLNDGRAPKVLNTFANTRWERG